MRRINYKHYLANQEHFRDYEDFKNIKEELIIYDFKVLLLNLGKVILLKLYKIA